LVFFLQEYLVTFSINDLVSRRMVVKYIKRLFEIVEKPSVDLSGIRGYCREGPLELRQQCAGMVRLPAALVVTVADAVIDIPRNCI